MISLFCCKQMAAWMKATYHVLANSLLTYSATEPTEEPGEEPTVSPYADIRFRMQSITAALAMGTPGPGYKMTNITPKRQMR